MVQLCQHAGALRDVKSFCEAGMFQGFLWLARAPTLDWDVDHFCNVFDRLFDLYRHLPEEQYEFA